MAKLVSKVYGDALFSLALEIGQVEELADEIGTVQEILDANPPFARLMEHPNILKENKLEALETVFSDRINKDLLGLMRQIVIKGHYRELDRVFAHYIQSVKAYKNIGVVTVTSARPLRQEQKAQVEERLAAITDYAGLEMDYQEDAGLIGGLVVRIGDRVVDGSVRTRLEKLSDELSKIQLKVGEYAP